MPITGGLVAGAGGDPLSQYLYLPGRTGGQHIGSSPPGGLKNTDDISMSGRLNIGTSNFVASGYFQVSLSLTGTTTQNTARITPSIGVSGLTNATYRALLVQITGGASISSGSPSFTGARYAVTIAPAIAVGTIIGQENVVSCAGGVGSGCSVLMGTNSQVTGNSTYNGQANDIQTFTGYRVTMDPAHSNIANLRGLEFQTPANSIYGVTVTARAIDFETLFATGDYATQVLSCTYTNGNATVSSISTTTLQVGMLVTGANIPARTYIASINAGASQITLSQAPSGGGGSSLTFAGTISSLSLLYKSSTQPTNCAITRLIDFQGDDYSQHYGNFYFHPPTPGSYPVPTAYLHIGAGTTAANTAPIKLTSGSLMSTPEVGAIEFLSDDLYFTITTGAARKACILNDGANLTSGRIPIATTNGRLVDDADLTFSGDTLTVTKIASTKFIGDIEFSGGGSGLPFGSCYGNHFAWTQASAAQNTWYVISDSGIDDGQLNEVTHDGNGQLTVTKGGRYLINYNITMEIDASNLEMEATPIIDGSPANDGRSDYNRQASNAALSLSGTCIISMGLNSTISVGVRTTDAGTPNITVEHLNLTVVQIGG